MNIIIVGCGKVGFDIAKQLSQEIHHVPYLYNIVFNGAKLRIIIDTTKKLGIFL